MEGHRTIQCKLLSEVSQEEMVTFLCSRSLASTVMISSSAESFGRPHLVSDYSSSPVMD